MSNNNGNNNDSKNLANMIDLGADFLVPSRGGSAGGRKANVAYQIVARPVVNLPMQAKVVILLINRAQSENGLGYVTEPELEKILIAARDRGDLVTDQSPWRIFTYYRARLIDEAKCMIQIGVSLK